MQEQKHGLQLEKCSGENWYPIIRNKQEYKEMRLKSPIEIKIIYKNLKQSNV